MPKRKRKYGRLFFLLLIVVAATAFLYVKNAFSPMSLKDEFVTFEIVPGERPKTIISNLKRAQLIQNEWITMIYAKVNQLNNFKAGTFEINKHWDLVTILQHITDATNAKHDDVKITIIEGDWAKHIAETFEEKLGISSDELLTLWNDETYIRSLMPTYSVLTEEIFNPSIRIKLEGYLFPETYNFAKNATADDVTRKLLSQTQKVYDSLKDKIDASNLSTHELFTLASIVQYESGNVTDMKKIAGVFYNRLAINMKLQSSVTVCYAVNKEKTDDWTVCEVNPTFESPYNTYLYSGLPPGPILNFGKLALEATLSPEKSDYLYFMADVYGDGKVYYAKTYEEHKQNVRKYLR